MIKPTVQIKKEYREREKRQEGEELMEKERKRVIKYTFLKEVVYKQLALGWQIGKQLSGLYFLSLSIIGKILKLLIIKIDLKS